jgi:hypothetical protein
MQSVMKTKWKAAVTLGLGQLHAVCDDDIEARTPGEFFV